MPYLIDSTLRDGAQAPDIHFAESDAVAIAAALDAAGLDEIEAGIPAIGADIQRRIRRITARSRQAAVSAWCRARISDIDACAELGLDLIHISLPTSDRWLAGCGLSWDDLVDRLPELIARARRYAPRVAVGAIDASRSPSQRLFALLSSAHRAGACRVRLADTVGVWTPGQAAETVRNCRAICPEIAVGIHAHDDLGQAVAVTLAGLEAGADWADVTVLGIGERCGNCSLEPLALALALQYQRPSRVMVSALTELAQVVARASGRTVRPDHPVVGEQAFSHRSGIHVHQQARDELACQPCSAAVLQKQP